MHFGFRESVSQPNVEGFPGGKEPPLPTGQFVLGYKSQWTDYKYPYPTPRELGFNGSFVAYVKMEQDVVAFEEFLDQAARASKLSRDLIAAKLCGRWANGSPLVTAAADPTQGGPRHLERLRLQGRRLRTEVSLGCPHQAGESPR